jgi:hypothetical protein
VPRSLRSLARLLLLIPFVLPLVVPLYARTHPRLGPFPFFLWFQFALVAVTVLGIGLVFLLRERGDERPR